MRLDRLHARAHARGERDRVSLSSFTWAVLPLLAITLAGTPGSVSAQPAGPPGPPIVDVVVEGAEILDPARVRALSGLTGSSAATDRVLREGIRTLWRSNLFDDVAITSRPDPRGRGVILVVRVDEAPIITEVEFTGIDDVKERDVEGAAGLRRGQRIPRHLARQAELDIEDLYREKSYYLAEATVEPERSEADSTAVLVEVREGAKVAIEAIEFLGNETFGDSRLRDAIETNPEGFWFWQAGEFDEETWRADVARALPEFYGRHGYLDMRVVADSMQVDPERGKMRLFVAVEEGPRYTVGDVTIDGNSRFSRADLEGFLQLRPGQVFDTGAVSSTRDEIQNLYADDGYIYAQVQPVRRARPDTTVVDLTWQIREGNPARIRHVEIRGNTVTHESVIRRHLFVQPGERFRRSDVRNSLLSLEGLGFFEPGIVPNTTVADEETGDIDLTFEVQERRTGSLTLGAAVGGGTGLSGFIGYEQPNLFGQAKSGRVRWEFGSRNNNIELGYTEPIFLGSKTSASFSFFDIDRRFINTSFRQNAIGGSVRFGTPLPWDDATRVFYGYQWQRIDLEDETGDRTRFQEDFPRTESSVQLGIVRDTRLPRNHPIVGARHSLNTNFAGGPFGGSVGFQKFEFESSWFAPTSGTDRTTLNLKIKGGGVNETRFIPVTDQFLLGGVQFPAEGLRGYRDNCVGTRTAGAPRAGIRCGDDRGNAFLVLTAEHFVKITDTIYVSAFYDAGNVWSEFGDVNFGDLKRGAGVGVQVDLPGFGPLGLDYGYGFDRVDRNGNPAPGWELHFRFGNFGR